MRRSKIAGNVFCVLWTVCDVDVVCRRANIRFLNDTIHIHIELIPLNAGDEFGWVVVEDWGYGLALRN